jgi:chemotaxis protein methyltransferase CheR
LYSRKDKDSLTRNVHKDQFEIVRTDGLIGKSESLRYIQFKISQVAPTNASVLIQGETGTGKELVARAIHNQSSRAGKPFVKVNCASIPQSLIESELFGHEKGAFTSANERRIGRFETADGGTIFLDEIGDLPLSVQPKLLHVLQQGEFERIGSSKTIKTNVRIISATNKVLEDEIKKGNFRNDLFYRLNVFPISIAPLRDRKDDIPIIANYYTNFYCFKFNVPLKFIPADVMGKLTAYSWPGNIRELENLIERGVIVSLNDTLHLDVPSEIAKQTEEFPPLAEMERTYIIKVLDKTLWKVSGKNGAAEILKLNPETLRSKMRKLGIKRPDKNIA